MIFLRTNREKFVENGVKRLERLGASISRLPFFDDDPRSPHQHRLFEFNHLFLVFGQLTLENAVVHEKLVQLHDTVSKRLREIPKGKLPWLALYRKMGIVGAIEARSFTSAMKRLESVRQPGLKVGSETWLAFELVKHRLETIKQFNCKFF